MNKKFKECPICSKNMRQSQRYPNCICPDCYQLTVTDKGETITFINEDIWGGFKSIVNNKQGEIHECYVNNIKCYADEARFGGIVISKIMD